MFKKKPHLIVQKLNARYSHPPKGDSWFRKSCCEVKNVWCYLPRIHLKFSPNVLLSFVYKIICCLKMCVT